MIRTLHLLRPSRLVLLLTLLGALLAINAVNVATRSGRPQTQASAVVCPPNDPARRHFAPLGPELTPPPSMGGRPESAELTWVGFAKPMAVDFTSAVLLNDEDKARGFVAPDYNLDIPELRRYLGIACQPDMFTARWAMVSIDQAVIELTLYYADSRVTFRVIFRPYPDQWRIVAVEPRADARPASP